MTWLGLVTVALFLAATSQAEVIVNVAFQERRPLAPGVLAIAFGDFAGVSPTTANSSPLP